MKLEFVNTMSHPAAARAVAVCMLTVRGWSRSGKRSGPRSWIIVRARARALRRDHPVGEVNDVDGSDEPLNRGAADRSPRPARGMRERHGRDTPVDREPGQRFVQQPAPPDADRPEGHELVRGRARARLQHSSQSPEDVVADARPRMREGRDVVRDSHGAA